MDSLIAIDQCPFLVDMINNFASGGGTFTQDTRSTSSGRYDYETNTVFINKTHFSGNDQRSAMVALAHELGHALSSTRLNFTSAADMAQSSCLWEGEAMFYEFLAFVHFFPEKAKQKEYYKWRWLDNATEDTRDNVYDEFYKIIYGSPPSDEFPESTPVLSNQMKIDLAALNREFKNNSIGGIYELSVYTPKDGKEYIGFHKKNGLSVYISDTHPLLADVHLTYDEQMKWHWLQLYSNFAIDLAYMGQSDYVSRIDDNNTKARDWIEQDKSASSQLKVMVNQAHKGRDAIGGEKATDYFGTEGDDVLRAEKDGSVLGNHYAAKYQKRTELLWGGDGNDIIHGSTVGDILLGGADNDHLYGYGGSDELMGDEGNDYLYGGNGDYTLYGGLGNDYLSGDDDISPDGTQFTGTLNPGRDSMYGGGGDDHLYGGGGDDWLFGDGSHYMNTDGKIIDSFRDETIQQDSGDGHLYGGDSGDDEEKVHSGNDTIYGGSGKNHNELS